MTGLDIEEWDGLDDTSCPCCEVRCSGCMEWPESYEGRHRSSCPRAAAYGWPMRTVAEEEAEREESARLRASGESIVFYSFHFLPLPETKP